MSYWRGTATARPGRRFHRSVAVTIAMATLLVSQVAAIVTPTPVAAQTATGVGEEQRSAFERARAADEAGHYDEAIGLYREAIALDPGARQASRALARARQLEGLIATGDPALSGLQHLRQSYAEAGSEASLVRARALLETATTGAGRARVDMWIADELSTVGGDVDQAMRHYLAVIDNPDASSADVVRAAILGGRAAPSTGDLRALRRALVAAEQRRGDFSGRGSDTAVHELTDLILRRAFRPLSWTFIVALLALALATRSLGSVRRLRWAPVAAIVYVFAAGAFLGERWEHGHAAAFLTALPAAVLVHAMSLAAAPPDSAGTPRRIATAFVIFGATIGAIYLVFDAFGHHAILGL